MSEWTLQNSSLIKVASHVAIFSTRFLCATVLLQIAPCEPVVSLFNILFHRYLCSVTLNTKITSHPQPTTSRDRSDSTIAKESVKMVIVSPCVQNIIGHRNSAN